MEITNILFNDFNDKNVEGIVCLGAGGELNEWVEGVSNELNNQDIVNGTPDQLWSNVYKLETTEGRIDLAFVFNNDAKFNLSKMCVWRLNFGDCSWISDYKHNYSRQH